MSELITLFSVFFKLGLFCFGGGYVMIPLIQDEILKYGWITPSEFYDIIAVTEITPGPIAINAATFVGHRTAGIAGAFCATSGVILPSFILVLIISKFFFKFNENPVKKSIFYCVRPAVMGMIVYAAMSVAQTSVFKSGINAEFFKTLISSPASAVDIKSLIIFIAAFLLLLKTKINPIFILIAMAVVGIFVF